jgi:hypothetical protein
MTNYVEINLNLSPAQRQAIGNAVQNNSSVRLKLTHSQLLSNNAKLYVTPTQYNRIQKAIQMGKGVMLTLSKKQLDQMKRGGFLPLLIPLAAAAIGALAPTIFNRIFPPKEGNGIMLPGSRSASRRGQGIYLPGGRGVDNYLTSSNGEPTSYNISGDQTSYLPDAPMNFENSFSSKNYRGKPLQAPKITRGRGLGEVYLHPQSEKYQMLN